MNLRPSRPNRYAEKRPRPRRRLILLALAVGLAVFFFAHLAGSRTTPGPEPGPPRQGERVPLEPGVFELLTRQAAGAGVRDGVLAKNETVSGLLTRMGLDSAAVYHLTRAAAGVMDMRRIQPGSRALVRLDEKGQPVSMTYELGQGRQVVVVNTPAGFMAAVKEFEAITLLAAASGEIETSFWETAVSQLGLSPELVLSFSDIFAYDVDFFTEIRQGDRFEMLYEKKLRRGRYLGPGRILAARFFNNGRQLAAFYHAGDDGEGGYYNAAGVSLKRMFLKSPLRYSRISSYFSRSRFHPILKIYRPHLGVDYAAPSGTPIESIGDGVVTELGWKGGYGRFIAIRHSRTYTSTYGHLKAYARGLKKGKRVSQGEVIGYVGASGLATGPHLDFRITHNGRFINPLTIRSEPAPPLKASEKKVFLAGVERREEELAALMQK